jgi:hypothetical protein
MAKLMTLEKVDLLTVMSDGEAHDSFAFGSGTLSWARRAAYVELVLGPHGEPLIPRRNRITRAGFEAFREACRDHVEMVIYSLQKSEDRRARREGHKPECIKHLPEVLDGTTETQPYAGEG